MKSWYAICLCLFNIFSFATVFHAPKSVWMDDFIERDPQNRKSSHPFISGDTFRCFCDHIFDETGLPIDTDKIKKGDTIFLNKAYLNYFFKYVHPEISQPYILVSHNDLPRHLGGFAKFIDDDKIIAWFAQNIDIADHPKLIGLPLGFANNYWPHGKTNVIERMIKKEESRDKLLYFNMKSTTHSSRKTVADHFKDQPYCWSPPRKGFEPYLADLKSAKFVLSPRGTCIDCHRTWEALLMGAIPIVPSTTINQIYEQLPVIIVDDWSNISQEFLEHKWQEFQEQPFDYDRLFADYWLNRIRQVQKQARQE